MAYSQKVAVVAKKMGYQYILVDELAFPRLQIKKIYQENQIKTDRIYEIENLKDFLCFLGKEIFLSEFFRLKSEPSLFFCANWANGFPWQNTRLRQWTAKLSAIIVRVWKNYSLKFPPSPA